MLKVFFDKLGVLVCDFFFQLVDLVVDDFEFSFEFRDFVLGFNEVFGVDVTVGSDVFVEVLNRKRKKSGIKCEHE
jgi:hypothetical protein